MTTNGYASLPITPQRSRNGRVREREADAEQAFIGALLLDGNAYGRLTTLVTRDDFADARHSAIFSAISELRSNQRSSDAITVQDHLARSGELEAAGGGDYIAHLIEVTASAVNIDAYANMVRDYAIRRKLYPLAADLVAGADRGRDLAELLAAHTTAVAALQINSGLEPLALIPVGEFAAQRPPMSWLIRDLLPAKAIAVLFGAPKSGKTNVTADLLMHAAHGLDWHGHGVSCPRRVAYLAGEGHIGLQARFNAWGKKHGLEHPETLCVLAQALPLISRLNEVLSMLREFRPDVVAVDTLNAYFGDLDENSTCDMTCFMSAIRRVRDELGCAVLLLHHVGNGNVSRERGSSVLRGAVDVSIEVAREGNWRDGHIGVRVIAARDMEPWETSLSLRLVPADTDWADEDGKPINTCLVTRGNCSVSPFLRKGRPLTKHEEAVIGVVHELVSNKASEGPTVLLARGDVVAAAIDLGVPRTCAYRACRDLANRFGWRLLGSKEIEIPTLGSRDGARPSCPTLKGGGTVGPTPTPDVPPRPA